MDFLWSPWRFQYVGSGQREKGCIFCRLAENHGAEADASRYVLYRGEHNYIVLNLYPYTSGHALIVPYPHLALLSEAEKQVTDEMMDLARRMQQALGEIYRPDGYNLGMNLGAAAGAGVAEHFHLHLMPRWFGDSNFMTTIGETRVLPETLADTYQKLKRYF
ncbi:MAG TPA: HIT domain-containing protein [Blastocatellia bacterium]|nr:HIT domain-containing protein [Blastocatellia bacterium]